MAIKYTSDKQNLYDFDILFISIIFVQPQLNSSLTTFRYDFRTAHNHTTQENKLSQAELGKIVETSGDIIGRYERDKVKPSIKVVIRMADALEVSLDYLVGKTDMELDNSTLNRIQEVSNCLKKIKNRYS